MNPKIILYYFWVIFFLVIPRKNIAITMDIRHPRHDLNEILAGVDYSRPRAHTLKAMEINFYSCA